MAHILTMALLLRKETYSQRAKLVMSSPLTVGEIATIYSVPAWKIRRVVDGLDADIPRAGLYRLVPRELLGTIAVELQRQGWLASSQEAAGGGPP